MASRKVLDARVAGAQLEMPRHPRVEPISVQSILQKRPSRPHCLSADATSLDALRMMAEHDIGAVLVLEGGRLAGCFSERDHARSSLRATQTPAAIPLREVMTPCDISAGPGDSVQHCLSLMTENRLRYLPVQDGDSLIALLSLDDFLCAKIAYLERVFKENELDQRIVFLRGTYSC